LQPLYAVLDLYLAAEADRFSERDAVRGWRRITANSLQRGLTAGMTLDSIVRFLQQYCEKGIPTAFLIRLKLWGNGYGEQQGIAVEHAPLLRLSESILRDLQADDELTPLLSTEIEPDSRLVRIKAEHLERIIELLQERGFVVE
jgi:hypothetical protein